MGEPLIKNKAALYIAIILIIPLLYFITDRIQLIHVGKHVIGKVEKVISYNDRCSRRSGKRTTYYDCTKYTATIGFDTLPPPPSIHNTFELSGGSERGRDQPISYSSRQEGDFTRVIYDPNKITRVYEDTILGIWIYPILIFFQSIIFLIGAFFEKEK